jgi:hypothetical protein
MKEETTYDASDLVFNIPCRCCNETDEGIVEGDGRCPSCIEEEKFIEWTMKGKF